MPELLLDLPCEIRDLILEYALITSRPSPSEAEITARVTDPTVMRWYHRRTVLVQSAMPVDSNLRPIAFERVQELLAEDQSHSTGDLDKLYPADPPHLASEVQNHIHAWMKREEELRQKRSSDSLSLLMACHQLNEETNQILSRIPSFASLDMAVYGGARKGYVGVPTWTFIPPKSTQLETVEVTLNRGDYGNDLNHERFSSRENLVRCITAALSESWTDRIPKISTNQHPKIKHLEFKIVSPSPLSCQFIYRYQLFTQAGIAGALGYLFEGQVFHEYDNRFLVAWPLICSYVDEIVVYLDGECLLRFPPPKFRDDLLRLRMAWLNR